ncbi:MAG: hypothetical protein VW547_08795 [Alphaproteobacteria bacterium]|jgi:hypothetical protein
MGIRPSYSAGMAAVALMLSAVPAAADAIDGNWCNGAKRLEIAGPTIVTPGGNRIQGDYGRHDFSYIVPGGEENAGKRVDMDLWGDDDMQLWPNGRTPDPKAGGAQMWKRCAAPTS